jgi:hypothetical protein
MPTVASWGKTRIEVSREEIEILAALFELVTDELVDEDIRRSPHFEKLCRKVTCAQRRTRKESHHEQG